MKLFAPYSAMEQHALFRRANSAAKQALAECGFGTKTTPENTATNNLIVDVADWLFTQEYSVATHPNCCAKPGRCSLGKCRQLDCEFFLYSALGSIDSNTEQVFEDAIKKGAIVECRRHGFTATAVSVAAEKLRVNELSVMSLHFANLLRKAMGFVTRTLYDRDTVDEETVSEYLQRIAEEGIAGELDVKEEGLSPLYTNEQWAGKMVIHKKSGAQYQIILVGVTHTETEEQLVLYTRGDGKVWARPAKAFFDGRFMVVTDGNPS